MAKVAKVKVVTGFVPIAGHPRTPTEYGMLGEQLRGLKAPVHPFYGVVTSTWLYNLIKALPFQPTWAVSDNSEKNTLAYHCVQHEKFNWLYQASRMDTDSDTFVWLDYGITRLIPVEDINEFLGRIKKGDTAIPGCWPVGNVGDDNPCWRFCGGVFVVARRDVQPLKNLIQAITMSHLKMTKKVTFEVNSLARAEQTRKVPIRWYQADHDASMVRNY